jgi:hypothetical protein
MSDSYNNTPDPWVPRYEPVAPDPGFPTGYLVLQPKPRPHTCMPPVTTLRLTPIVAVSVPAAPVGVVWRCHCGRLWQVAETPEVTRGQQLAERRAWVRASWWTRWRYRSGRVAEFHPFPYQEGDIP